jgi:hypothetical protein
MVSFDTNIFVYATLSAPRKNTHTHRTRDLLSEPQATPRPTTLRNSQAAMLMFAEPWLDHADARRPALFVAFRGPSTEGHALIT